MAEEFAIGLVAHDAMKAALKEWVVRHADALCNKKIYATGTTASVLADADPRLNITPLKSGPLGGDQQLGGMICEGKLHSLVFFQDPMTAQPHDVDVKALVRLSTLYNVALACNPATADLLLESPRFGTIEKAGNSVYDQFIATYSGRDVNAE